jgi:hypothetical protein
MLLCKDVAEAGQGKRQGAGAGSNVSGSSAAFRSIAKGQGRGMEADDDDADLFQCQCLSSSFQSATNCLPLISTGSSVSSPPSSLPSLRYKSPSLRRGSLEGKCAYLVHNRQTRSHGPQSFGCLFLLLTVLLVLTCLFPASLQASLLFLVSWMDLDVENSVLAREDVS